MAERSGECNNNDNNNDYTATNNNNTNNNNTIIIKEGAGDADYSEIRITIRVKDKCPKNKVSADASSDPQKIKLHNESFTFDNIKWGNESLERIYKAAAYPFVENALKGQSSTIIAYGPVRAGKSYVMGTRVTSTMNNWQNSGLIQRCLKHIFEENKIQVTASFVGICGGKFHDLLNVGSAAIDNGVTFDPKIEGIKSLEDGLQLFNRALEIRRDYNKTNSNSSTRKTASSRSHVFITLRLKIEDGNKFLESELNLVDLAGSKLPPEINAEFDSSGGKIPLDESLSALSRVVKTMTKEFDKSSMQSDKKDVLGSVLEDLFINKSPVSLIACISTDPASNGAATSRTLRIADDVQNIKNRRLTGSISADLSTDEVKPGTEDLAIVPSTETIKIGTVDNKRDKGSVTSPFMKNKIKNCMVILHKSVADFYSKNVEVESEENTELVLNDDEIHVTEDQELPSSDIEAEYSAETQSTLSISRLQTQNTAQENDIKTEVDSNCVSEEYPTCYDHSFSPGSLRNIIITQNAVEIETNVDDVLENGCQCLIHEFEDPTELLEISQSNVQNIEEMECGLVDNVSQLSIEGSELIKPPYLDAVMEQAFLRSGIMTNDVDSQIPKNKQLSQLVIKSSTKMKRMNAILTTDFSQPGPSQSGGDYETPRKMMKLDEKNDSSSTSSSSSSSADSHSERSAGGETPTDDNHCDNIENNEKEINDKQRAHNNNILRILNTCTAEELTDLPRIGFKTAVSMYQYRLIHGDFRSLKSLVKLPFWTEKVCRTFFAANNVFFE